MDRTRELRATNSPASQLHPGVVRCNGDLVITDASLALCRFLARRRQELIGESLLAFVDGADLAPLTGEVCQRLMGERLDSTTLELNFLDRRGVPRPGRLTLTWLPEPESSFVGSVWSLGTNSGPGEDPTAAAAVAERAPDLIWRLRLWPEPSFEYVSPSSTDLLGYPPSAFYGEPQLLANLAADQDEEAKIRALYDGQWNPHEPMELHLVHRDGGVRTLEQRTTGIMDGERRVLAIEAISRDVTGRRGVEAELVAEVTVKRVLDQIDGAEAGTLDPAAVLRQAVDAIRTEAGWPLGHVLLMDDAHDSEAIASSFVSHGADDGDRFEPFTLATDGQRWPTEGDQSEAAVFTGDTVITLTSDAPLDSRARVAEACGMTSVVSVPVPVIDGIGAVLEFYTEAEGPQPAHLSLLHNIVPQVGMILDRSREVQDLRRMDEARTEFVTRAAHELRGPVGSISVMATALALEARRSGALDLSGSLERLAAQAERIQLLATRLLELSQLEQGRLEVTLDAVVLRDAVDQAVENLLRSNPPPVVEVDPDVKVLADPIILDELLANLVANAERHGGPHIQVTATTTKRAGKPYVAVTVSDDGPGVEDRLVPLLFEPLRHSLTSPTHSGLGLALVRQMALTLGGDVIYEPGDPQGARFTFFLAPA